MRRVKKLVRKIIKLISNLFMRKIIELKIKDNKKIYQELTKILAPHREEATGYILFIVEGTKKNPIIGIRYPGKKVFKRKKLIKWGNLFDFEVVIYENNKEIKDRSLFTFSGMLYDFYTYKKDNEEFWGIIEELYKTNKINKKIPRLRGINSSLFLLALKWIWIQEDLNYKLSWKDVNSSVRYGLYNKKQKPMSKGAGRGKFFGALVLAKFSDFTFDEIVKIIPPFG